VGEDEVTPGFEPVSPRDLRVSDAEREHVVGVLQKAIGRGMIDLDEFTERTDIALAARTRGELNVVLADLPGLVHRGATVSAMAPPPTGDPSRRLELTAHGSTLSRAGRWVVPAEVLVRNKYGSTRLDFTEAQVDSVVVRIDLDTKWGSVELVIPEQAAVDLNAITEVKWGSVEERTHSNGHAGTPLYVVTGRVHGGSLTVRNPRHGLFG
jgi:hypothetical protein